MSNTTIYYAEFSCPYEELPSYVAGPFTEEYLHDLHIDWWEQLDRFCPDFMKDIPHEIAIREVYQSTISKVVEIY